MPTTEPTGELSGRATWRDPAWLAAALDRAREQVGDLDRPPEQRHVTAWSTAIRLPVRGGAVWLKSMGSGSAHEPSLTASLGEWIPDHVLVPIAVDPVRLRVCLDVYVDVWREHGDPGELREEARLALAVGPLQRALTWRRVLRGVVPEDRQEWQDSVPGWTAEHLEPGSL